MKLIDLLREIGETPSSEPKEISRYKGSAEYKFSTDKNEYRVRIEKKPDVKNMGLTLEVIFGVLEGGDVSISRDVNDPKNVFKVMSNVISAVDQEIKKTEETGVRVTSLEFAPNDSKRANVYLLYVKKRYEHSEVRQSHNKTYMHVTL